VTAAPAPGRLSDTALPFYPGNCRPTIRLHYRGGPAWVSQLGRFRATPITTAILAVGSGSYSLLYALEGPAPSSVPVLFVDSGRAFGGPAVS